MIRSLHIENYALIERMDLLLHSGFSTITGETGAGKSIILGALGLLRGQRADSKSVKNGAQRCVVEAVFDVGDYGMDDFFRDNDFDFDGHECIIRRELTAAGKSRAFINDTPASLAQLKELGEKLIDIHSQHQNLLLNKEDFQLSILDILAGSKTDLEEYHSLFHAMKKAEQELNNAVENARRSQEDEDYLRFQVNQIEEAQLQENEDKELEEEQVLLEHAEDIKQALFQASTAINNEELSVLNQLKDCCDTLNGIADNFPMAKELSDRIDSCYIELKDIADELDSESERMEYDPERLDVITDRLDIIYSLLKKHHAADVSELMGIYSQFKASLDEIENSEEHIEEKRKIYQESRDKVLRKADVLTKLRNKASKTLETEIVSRLSVIGIPAARFRVEMEHDKEPGLSGQDKVTFLFSANKNVAMQKISSVASGGEISRVMLSLKAIIANAVKLPTIIFDEIDTGVSGTIADKMAHIMQEMGAANRQVISITHLPQIAATGTHHYKVWKDNEADTTTTHVTELTLEERIQEIANMLSGEKLTQAAINNAKSLLGAQSD